MANLPKFREIEFRSLDHLAELIHLETSGWDTRWYRGVKSPEFGLLPKVLREKNISAREGYISVEFRRRSRAHLSNMSTPFDWLCGAQHFGIPTRLLDWTESLPVALFFSIRPVAVFPPRPTIWVLNPHDLNGFATGEPEVIPISSDPRVIANADLAFGDNAEENAGIATNYPMPVAPDFIFPRLASQNGCFTIHGKDERPLDDIVSDKGVSFLKKFVASTDSINKIYGSMDLLIPSEDAIFPDIDGIRNYIV